MIRALEIAGGAIAIYFIIAMYLFFGYVLLRKGSLKKSLLHILLSVLLLVGVVGIYMTMGQQMAVTEQASVVTSEIQEMLQKAPEEASKEELATVAGLAALSMTEEDKAFLEQIKKFYIYHHRSQSKFMMEEGILAERFDDIRASVD